MKGEVHTPYETRVLLLNMEEKIKEIRIYNDKDYCMICIDKEDKKDNKDG